MKVIILALLAATASTTKLYTEDKEVTNAEKWWGNDFEKYKAALEDGDSNNCQIRESRNWKGAQQCTQSWECRGAEPAKEVDGAADTTAATRLLFLTRPQDWLQIAEPTSLSTTLL